MRLTVLLPHLAGLQVEHASVDDQTVTLVVRSPRRTAACPVCRRHATHVHGRYVRSVADLPCAGRPVRLHLRVRRFWCTNPACPRTIFAERFPAVAAVRARRTPGNQAQLTEVGFALGGRAGARLAQRQGVPTSRSTLLRLVRAAPEPAPTTPRVLGVDDFARRRGQTYGTVLTNQETGQPVDLLPDRTADTLAHWLAEHGGVEVICRDRAGAYADGARRGAPDAVQVADRFHLSCNAGDALERVLARRHAALRDAAAAVDRAVAGAAEAATAPPAAPAPPVAVPTRSAPAPGRSQTQQDSRVRRDRRLARYEQVRALQAQGVGLREIARRLGMGRQTVRRFVRAGGFPERAEHRRRPTMLTPYEPYLQARWAAGCQNTRQLWEEIRARGFPGSAGALRHALAGWRTEPSRRGRAVRRVPADQVAPAPPPPTRVPSPRQACWILLRPAEALRPAQQAYREQVLRCPELARAQALAVEFCRLVRERDHAALAPWLAAAKASELGEFREFAAGIERDRAAVEAAVTTPWSSGCTEGQVNRIKMVKRQMFGRAKFDLLRKRVLRIA
jgi:transposase